jgi:hypothetical protein
MDNDVKATFVKMVFIGLLIQRLQRIPSFFLIRLIRQMPVLTPLAKRSRCSLSGPEIPRVLAWAAFISIFSRASS